MRLLNATPGFEIVEGGLQVSPTMCALGPAHHDAQLREDSLFIEQGRVAPALTLVPQTFDDTPPKSEVHGTRDAIGRQPA